nr:MAG TPA: hypothetical protein [Caudoviricetes sp.]
MYHVYNVFSRYAQPLVAFRSIEMKTGGFLYV